MHSHIAFAGNILFAVLSYCMRSNMLCLLFETSAGIFVFFAWGNFRCWCGIVACRNLVGTHSFPFPGSFFASSIEKPTAHGRCSMPAQKLPVSLPRDRGFALFAAAVVFCTSLCFSARPSRIIETNRCQRCHWVGNLKPTLREKNILVSKRQLGM